MLTFDYNNCLSDLVGSKEGLTAAELAAAIDSFAPVMADVRAQRAAGKLPMLDLPHQPELVRRINDWVAQRVPHFDSVVVIGIGGSALGAAALHSALNHPFHNLLSYGARKGRPRMFFLDNVDPEETAGLLEALDLEKTLINVVTKSGETAETIAGLQLFLKAIKVERGDKWKEHVVVTTDPKKGFLRRWAAREGLDTFEVPPGVGGRFSVFTPVGLLPAALAGIDIGRLLAGAAVCERYCASAAPAQCPAFVSALLHYLLDTRKGKHVAVMFPYARCLRDVADWFRQLWAESLGKKNALDGREVHTGQTAVKALGATDQHSQVQLYVEGPHDKMFAFLEVERWRRETEIPDSLPGEEAAGFLAGKGLGKLLNAEKRGTEAALVAAGRPNYTWRLAEVNEESLGALLYALEVQTVIAGRLYGVDAFDQPGVEAGKIATFALMGRKGYEAKAAELLSFSARQVDARRIVVPRR